MKDENPSPPNNKPANTVIHDQATLLTIHADEAGWIENALPGTNVIPYYLNQETGIWVLYVKLEPGTTIATHFHTGEVHLYTIKGSWYYLEHQHDHDIQKAGSYLYEPGGSYHTLRTDEGCEFFNVVIGSNVNFDKDGKFVNIMDAGWIRERITEVCKEQGREEPKYILAGSASYTK